MLLVKEIKLLIFKICFQFLQLCALWEENLCAGLKDMSKISFYAISIIRKATASSVNLICFHVI